MEPRAQTPHQLVETFQGHPVAPIRLLKKRHIAHAQLLKLRGAKCTFLEAQLIVGGLTHAMYRSFLKLGYGRRFHCRAAHEHLRIPPASEVHDELFGLAMKLNELESKGMITVTRTLTTEEINLVSGGKTTGTQEIDGKYFLEAKEELLRRSDVLQWEGPFPDQP